MHKNYEALSMANTLATVGTEKEGEIFARPARMESQIPHNFRLVHNKTTNTFRLQGAFKWEQGFAGGVTWKDLETVIEE